MKKRSLFIGISVVTLLFIVFIKISSKSYADTNTKVEKGRQYLINLEKMDVNEVEKKIQEKQMPVAVAADIQVSAPVTNINFKTYYENAVFMGDSLTEALSEFGYLDGYNVLAQKGQTVVMAKKSIYKMQSMHPAKIFLLYGMNDVIAFNKVEDFKTAYIDLISEIKSNLPNAEIYVQAPFPVMNKAVNVNKRLNNDNINQFRQAVQEVCQAKNVKYVDTSVLIKDTKSYEPDGVHFKYDFYKTYLTYLHDFINKNT